MKRALLIAGGTVGGLGAVLAITPPQFTSSQTINLAGGGIGNPSGNSATTAAPASTPSSQTSAPTQSASATPTTKQSAAATKAAAKNAATKKATSTTKAAVKSTNNNSSAAVTTAAAQDTTQTQSAAPAQTQAATPTPTAKGVSGTFTGPVVNVSYGNVQVQITVSNGKITDAQALQAPTGRNDRYSSFAVPILRKQTLAAQSDAIQGASGASYTSYGWYKSLQGALSKAGL
jgi:uncharacterized protein with FMN-binding domain